MTYLPFRGFKTGGAGFFLAPALATGVTLTPSATIWTYGSWAQIVASTGAAIYIAGIFPAAIGATGGQEHSIELGTGAAASEVAVSDVGFAQQTLAGQYPPILLPVWIPVAAGTRIAARLANSAANAANTLTVRLWCINQADVVPA
jgi:hypothetical protein